MNTDSHAEQFVSLNARRLKQAKAAHTTRRVRREAMSSLITGEVTPRPGDVLLARVDKLGKHRQLELCNGRRSSLFIGDEIVVAYGNRYAPDQFEAVVPENLDPCHLVAAGGVAAWALSWHEAISAPTWITPLGIIADARGARLNLRDTTLGNAPERWARPFTAAVAGTAMNAGKTTTAAQLIYGAVRAGMRVAAAKVTGTGSGGDTWLMRDAGADPVLDFTDLGFVSTYRVAPAQVENIMDTLVYHLTMSGAELIVLEIADGLYQEETAALLSSPVFARNVDAMLFAASDALGAAAGVAWLRERKLPVVGIAGTLTCSPLALREAGQATALPVYRLSQLSDPLLVCNQCKPKPEVGQAA
jgi:hypothetical protein